MRFLFGFILLCLCSCSCRPRTGLIEPGCYPQEDGQILCVCGGDIGE